MPENPSPASPWNWHPELPLPRVPIFVWPPRPISALKYIFGKGIFLSSTSLWVVLAFLTWIYLMPDFVLWKTFSTGWIVHVFLVNMGLTVLLAGGLHLYFYTFKRQGSARKFDKRELVQKSRVFFAKSQVWDNIFWTCAFGVPVWTLYQIGLMWAYGNGYIKMIEFQSNPVWFVMLFLVIIFWESTHFFFTHRLLHWKPLYKLAHRIHHRNSNTGPWSGFSMHPIEQVIFFSVVLIHLVIASHPIHLFFNFYFSAMAAITSHAGYSDVVIKGKPCIDAGIFHHQLHHRYFECNYGTSVVPWDRWFGSFHDGTAEATQRLNQRRYAMHSN